MRKILYYLPRIISIGVILFFAMFILEGFDPDFGWQSGLSHLIQTIIVLAVVIFLWRFFPKKK